MADVTPVVLAFTPNYFVPACTTIQSILRNSAATDRFHIIILLAEPLPEQMKDLLQQLDQYRLAYSFINLKGQLQDIFVDNRYTVAASYRLLLPDLLPDYNKVIYVDCDIIVRTNLAELYRLDLQNNYLAGVFEVPLDFQIAYMEKLACDPRQYMNSGFLVMDLQKMREDDLVVRFMEAAKVDYLQFPDQDVLNQVCKGRILGLKPYYNSIRTFFLPQHKEQFLKVYSAADLREVHDRGNIHYTGTKPWEAFTIRFTDWWLVYWTLPKAIQEMWHVNTKLPVLARILNTRIGAWTLGSVQSVYRQYKYK